MAETTTFKLRLDDRQASASLRRLGTQAQNTAGKIGKGIRSTVGRGLGAVGLGGGFAAGAAAVRSSTESGFGAILGESLGPLSQQISDFFFGSLDEEARGARAARDEVAEAFGAIAGQMNGGKGGIPPGAHEMFQSIKTLRVQEERGKEEFARDERFRGPDVMDFIDRIGKVLGDELKKFGNWWLNKTTFGLFQFGD